MGLMHAIPWPPVTRLAAHQMPHKYVAVRDSESDWPLPSNSVQAADPGLGLAHNFSHQQKILRVLDCAVFVFCVLQISAEVCVLSRCRSLRGLSS